MRAPPRRLRTRKPTGMETMATGRIVPCCGNAAFNELVDHILAPFDYRQTSPWAAGPGETSVYQPDTDTLDRLLSIPVAQGTDHTSGRLGKAIDAWVAHELRRAGFHEHEVYPYRTQPRVLPPPIVAAKQIPGIKDHEALRKRLNRFGTESFGVVGEFYDKQIDVFMGSPSRGAELMVSTKSMSGSFDKNIKNRYEEFLGDAENLRTRFPLATIGVVYVVDSSILSNPESFSRLTEMLLRLKRRHRYDVSCLVVMRKLESGVRWVDQEMPIERTNDWAADLPVVSTDESHVPEELRTGAALADLVTSVLERIPSKYHREPRVRRSGDGASP